MNASRSGSRQSGFTLIEMVTVIVILGILASFALPRFVSIDKEARRASVKAVEGSIRSAAALAHSVYLTNFTGSTAPTAITVDGQTVAITNGYPSLDDMEKMLQSTDGYTISDVAAAAPLPATKAYAANGVADATQCRVLYAPPASTAAAPTVVATVTDCS